MASSSKNVVITNAENSFHTDDDIVILEVRSPDVDLEVNNTDLQIPEIYAWKLQASDILLSQPEIVKIHVHRNRLMEHSTYFQSLFGGSFKESSSDYIVIQWNLPTFVTLLEVIYAAALNLSLTNFVPLLEGALFFGVNYVIMECKNWSIRNLSSKKTKFSEVFLRQLIDVWNFGADNGIHFILELYTDFFAINFAAVLQCNSFVALPYALLNACISHPLLTVDSERQLCEAILNWLASNEQCSEFNSHETLDNRFQILEKVRVGLLPLEFILGRLWRDYPSMVAALQATVMADQISHNSSDIQFEDPELFRLRLTQYSEKLDLSGCQQVTAKVLFFTSPHKGMVDTSSSSLVPSETLKKLVGTKQPSEEVQWLVLHQSHLVTSLNNLQEVSISQCWRFHEEDIIDWLQLLTPSVRIFKSRYCSQLKVSILDKLSQACPLIEEADLSVDISPVAACKVSILHVSCEAYPSHQSSNWVLLHKPISCNLTRLSLKGRTDIRDNDLMMIAALSHSISVLNIDGCTSLTDRGISCFLSSFRQLHSLHAALTSFGQHSIKALLPISTDNDNSIMLEHDFSLSLHSSSSLVELDLGGCNDIDQTFLINYMACASSLSCLSLRHTNLGDEPLYAFKGTSLKELDVCETLVSGAALCYIISRNPELHVLNARGCRRLSDCQLLQELDGLLSLKELAVGWGLSGLSLEMMRPALASLKSLTVGLGGSLGTQAWLMLPRICPLLEHISVCFQVVSDEGIINALKNLRYMHTLELQNCFGELSSNILSVSATNLKSLRLDRVASWMTDSDLAMLTRNCRSLCQLSLAGCKFLTSDAQHIIACGWPGLTRIYLEDCSKVTANGVSYLLECRAVEDLLLRHNGLGVQRNFILKAALKLPLLRTLSLDLCDACESGFDTPDHLHRFSLCTVKLARCKVQRCAIEIENSSLVGPKILQPYHVHKDTIVLEWNTIEFKTTIVEERI